MFSGCVHVELVPQVAHVECRMGSPEREYKATTYFFLPPLG